MPVEFYDVKTRKKVTVPDNKLTKTKYEKKTASGAMRVNHALRGTLPDGRKLTKFVNKETWDKYKVPVE